MSYRSGNYHNRIQMKILLKIITFKIDFLIFELLCFLFKMPRVAWGILGRGVLWVSGLPTFKTVFFNDVLKVLETSHEKQMCSLSPKVSFVTSALF